MRFLLAMIFPLALFLLPPRVSLAREQKPSASITIDAGQVTAPINPLLFGHNVVFSGSGMWNVKLNDLDPNATSLVKRLSPTIVRFPGGSVSDLYLWEDGLGHRTSAEVTPTDHTITFDTSLPWGTVQKARFIDSLGGPFGDVFSFIRQSRATLEEVAGLQTAHPAGTEVRPDARTGQPDWVDNTYGIDEHLKLIHSLGAQAVLTVNYGTGLEKTGKVSTATSLSQRVKRAAAWVAYVNGSSTDTRSLGIDPEGNDWQTVGYWARKRARRGHLRPYGVRYWEIGNEVYGKWETGFTTARQYAVDCKIFAAAMKMVDPSIKVGVVGLADPHGRGDADRVDAWNATVVRVAGEVLDFLVLHLYYPSARRTQIAYTSPTWFTAIMAGAQQAISDLQEIRTIIAAHSAHAAQIELAITEYGVWPADSSDARDYSNLARALYDSDLLMSLVQQGAALNVSLATAWNLHGSNETAAIRYDWATGIRTVRPHYHAFRQVTSVVKRQLIPTAVSGPSFRTGGVTNVKPSSTVPVLHAIATTDAGDKTVNLLVLNRSLTEVVNTAIHFQGFLPTATVEVQTLHGPRIDAHSEDSVSGVQLAPSQVTAASPSFTYTFPPHSLTSLKFSADSADP